jgi:5-formyltetrahydrofolate cyclo-ligase
VQSVTDTRGGLAVRDETHHLKEAMRARIRAERRRRAPASREAAAHDLAAVALETHEISSARHVAVYASAPTSPGTVPLRRALIAAGVKVLLPVLSDDGGLDWSVEAATTPPAGQASPRSPSAPLPEDTIDLASLEGPGTAQVAIVPALAVDTLGNRLGQGAGVYDRALRMIDHSVPVFAVVFEDEVFDAAVEPVPTGSQDRPVDGIITPHRCLRLSPPSTGGAWWTHR